MINFITLQILNFFDYFHKKKILKFLKSFEIKRFNVVFDVGAHKGETLKFFLKHFIVNQVFSFEASKENYENLKKNLYIFTKKFSNSKIKIENIALGSENKIVKFKQFIESSSSTFSDINIHSKYFKKKFRFLNKKKGDNFFNEKELKISTLLDYLDENQIKHIDILKIDTEGYEFEILKGLKHKIKNVDIIYFEHHYDDMINKDYTFRDINNYLRKNNFQKIYRIKMPFRKTFEYIYRNKENILKINN